MQESIKSAVILGNRAKCDDDGIALIVWPHFMLASTGGVCSGILDGGQSQ